MRHAILLVAVLVAGCIDHKDRTTAAATKTYSREEFRKLVVGKTPDEVIAAVGKPESTQDSNDGRPMWTYKGLTVDPVTGKTDDMIFVHFKNGQAAKVNY